MSCDICSSKTSSAGRAKTSQENYTCQLYYDLRETSDFCFGSFVHFYSILPAHAAARHNQISFAGRSDDQFSSMKRKHQNFRLSFVNCAFNSVGSSDPLSMLWSCDFPIFCFTSRSHPQLKPLICNFGASFFFLALSSQPLCFNIPLPT